MESQRIRWIVESDEERESLWKMIEISVYRPFRTYTFLFYHHPLHNLIQHLTKTRSPLHRASRLLLLTLGWAVLYLTFGSIPLVFSVSRKSNIQQSSSVFAAISVGAILSTGISIYQELLLDTFLARATSTSNVISILRAPSPEGRLYFACIEGALLPLGLFWFGWTQFGSIPWILPTLAVGCATMGIYSVYLATFNYLADTYHRYASSALAAQSLCGASPCILEDISCHLALIIYVGRNILGGGFPLIAPAMFNHLTFAGASTVLGGIVSLSLPTE
jgi:hypothetical protein